MSDWGLKISLPGYDVNTATPEQCALHSGYPCPKIETNHAGYTLQKTLVLTLASNPGSNTSTNVMTASHPYSYVPAVAGTWLYDFGTGRGIEYGQMPMPVNNNDGFQLYATSSQIKVDMVRGATPVVNLTNTTFTLRYTIFVESGA